MNHLQVWPYRFHFLARAPAVFPQHQSGNILRGAFGTIFRRIACEPQCPGSLQCEIAQDCPYAQVFEPRWPAGPSGLADPPRAFVFRPTGLEGRNLQPGEPFWFDLHLFSPRPDLLAYFVLAFRQLGVEGIGPGRARVELVRVNALHETGEPGTAVFENGSLAGSAGEGIALTLSEPKPATGILRIQFLSPTEFKEAGSVAVRPEFGPLFCRLANRIGNLCALYQGGRPAPDLPALIHASDQMRIVGGSVSWAEVERRSSKTGQSHSLGGFTGSVDYQGDYQGDYGPFLPWLRAARWTGVGRQTVWGKGRIEAVEVNAAGA